MLLNTIIDLQNHICVNQNNAIVRNQIMKRSKHE
jgi:hypothetical protein